MNASDQSCGGYDQPYKAFLDTDAYCSRLILYYDADGRLLRSMRNQLNNARCSGTRSAGVATLEDPLGKRSTASAHQTQAVSGAFNGAGLAMATMDIIKYAGGMPANFGCGRRRGFRTGAHAFQILLSDKNVKAVLINIFGGILRVDTLATGVVEAAQDESSCRRVRLEERTSEEEI
jgi:succinyl-CoA synthetase beta subunit